MENSSKNIQEVLDKEGKVSAPTLDKIITETVKRETKFIKDKINTINQKANKNNNKTQLKKVKGAKKQQGAQKKKSLKKFLSQNQY